MTTQRVRILAAVLSLALVAGCGGRAEEQQADERIVPVSVAEVGMVRVTPTLEFSGTIEPVERGLRRRDDERPGASDTRRTGGQG